MPNAWIRRARVYCPPPFYKLNRPNPYRRSADTSEIGLDSFWGIVPQLEVFEHPLAQGSHRETYGLHGPTPSIERAVSRHGIHATPLMEESLWSRETTDGQTYSRRKMVVGRGCTRTQ